MKKVLVIFFATALLIGVSAHAANTGEATYPGTLPGSFVWNLKMFGEGMWKNILGLFSKQWEIDYINQRLSERNTELVGITSLVDAGTFTSRSSVQALQNAHDIAAGEYLQEQQNLGNIERSETNPSIFQNAVAYDPESMVDHWMKQRDALLRTELSDQTNGNAADLLLVQGKVDAVNQVIAQDDAIFASEQTASNLAVQNVGPAPCFVNKVETDACWVSDFQADEQDAFDKYDARDLTPNALVSALMKQMDGLIAQGQQAIQAGDNDKLETLVTQMFQTWDQISTGMQLQFQENDATPEAPENQAQPKEQSVQQPVPAPAPQPKPILKTIPSESVAQSPLGLLEIGTVLQGQVNVPFAKTFISGGGLPPYHYQLDTGVGFPPQGIVLDTNGVLSGTPTVSGDYTFGVCVVDTAGANDCEEWQMTVAPAAAPPAPVPVPTPTPTPEYSLVGSGSCGSCTYGGSGQCTMASGDASGPVGAQLYLEQDIALGCGSWTQTNFSGCVRGKGDPAETTWSVPPKTNGGVEIDIGTNDSEVGVKRLSFGPCY